MRHTGSDLLDCGGGISRTHLTWWSSVILPSTFRACVVSCLCFRDCPDLFDMVPESSLGACLEDEKVREPRETEAFVRLSCLKYNVSHTSTGQHLGRAQRTYLAYPLLSRAALTKAVVVEEQFCLTLSHYRQR